ncbi:MAG: hypothetical protein KF851_12075 [Pirellulaceae bacterium]|nr:hypothetical protein [Pirellulaceae bacterium]
MRQSDSQQFLETFFGNGNAIQWSQYATSSPTDAIRVSLEPWIVRFQRQHSPYCLPRVDATSKQTSWYVLCTDARQARSIRETLQSFIGPTYTKFNGEFATLSLSDPIEQLCQLVFGQLVFRLPVLDFKDRAKVNSLLSTMMEFRDRDSSRSLTEVKPIGRLLRDLEMAIIAGSEDSAHQIYSEIRSRGRLSATNLAFLQVHILAAFNHWGEILLMPNLSDLLQVRRPKRISENLAAAVYHHSFFKHEEANESLAAIEAFRNQGGRYQTLVRSTERFQSAAAIKFAFIAAVAADPPNRPLAEQLLSEKVVDSDRPWCESLVSHLDDTTPTAIVAEAVSSYDLAEIRYTEGNFDESFALYLTQSPTHRSVCRVLELAVEIDSTNAACKAIEYLESADDDIRGKVLGRRVCNGQIETLTSLLGQSENGAPKPISSLVEWFECLDGVTGSANLLEVLDYGIAGWSTATDFSASDIADRLQQSRTGNAAETIRNTVPLFVRTFLPDREAKRDNKPIYNALIELLIYDESIGGDDLTAVEQLVEAILTSAPSHDSGNNDFTFAADITKHLWETVAAPRYLDWALSMLDLLIDTGTQKHTNLAPMMVAIIESIRPWARRVTADQWSLFCLLASDLGLSKLLEGIRPEPEADAPADTTTYRQALKGKSIAVYSLTERIARRFGQLAEQAFEGIKIHYVHDKSLTDRMKSLAQSSDIFIINTWDAKHAATNGIKQNRPSSLVTVQPSGKSALSLLESLMQQVQGF